MFLDHAPPILASPLPPSPITLLVVYIKSLFSYNSSSSRVSNPSSLMHVPALSPLNCLHGHIYSSISSSPPTHTHPLLCNQFKLSIHTHTATVISQCTVHIEDNQFYSYDSNIYIAGGGGGGGGVHFIIRSLLYYIKINPLLTCFMPFLWSCIIFFNFFLRFVSINAKIKSNNNKLECWYELKSPFGWYNFFFFFNLAI